MDLGCCVGTEGLAALAAAGGDYCELSVARTVMGSEDDEGFARLVDQVAGAGLRPRAYNVLLPADHTVVGPAVERDRLEGYTRRAFGRIRRLSGDRVVIVVVGSGRSRSIPDGFDREVALGQLAGFLDWTSTLAAEHGITLALEPLRRAESNVFNSLRESAAFIRGRGLGGVRLLADIYHMMEEGEPLAAIDECAELIVHAHAADSGRRPPGQGDYPLAGFFDRLRHGGYAGDCSIECSWDDFPRQIGPSLDALRAAARAAGW